MREEMSLIQFLSNATQHHPPDRYQKCLVQQIQVIDKKAYASSGNVCFHYNRLKCCYRYGHYFDQLTILCNVISSNLDFLYTTKGDKGHTIMYYLYKLVMRVLMQLLIVFMSVCTKELENGFSNMLPNHTMLLGTYPGSVQIFLSKS